ncbi:hypothetical protein [Amycolatopsis magusensis]|uniref:hypothetical protein n=1 Tax=Amycolatopsis magusensis TaxID=882444 RepID=UPI00378A70A0
MPHRFDRSCAASRFRQALAQPYATAPDGREDLQLDEAAHDPQHWAARLDDWVQRHHEPHELPRARPRPVSDGQAPGDPVAFTS